jgi:hypothetical protein
VTRRRPNRADEPAERALLDQVDPRRLLDDPHRRHVDLADDLPARHLPDFGRPGHHRYEARD